MTKPKLAIIGCGQIAEFHAPALREAGFALAGACSSPGSPRVRRFAQRHDIPLVFDDAEQLLAEHQRWDAVLVAASIGPTLGILATVMGLRIPTLVEKPVTPRSAELIPLIDDGDSVIVGYNRRFYSTVQAARAEVADGQPVMAHLTIPDAVQTPERPDDDPEYLLPFFSNTVHGLDLARFVFGNLNVDHVMRLTNQSGAIYGIGAMLSANNGTVVQFTANWATPANFSLAIDRPGRRLELRPFEDGAIYEGMQVVEPTTEAPIRTYTPKLARKVTLEERDWLFKPGFLAQAQALIKLVNGEDPYPAARLSDAYEVLLLAEQLAGQIYNP